jgi:hypothetical protein
VSDMAIPFRRPPAKKNTTDDQQSYDDQRSYLTPLRAASHRDGHTDKDKDINPKKPITLPRLKFMEFSGEWDETV